MNIVSENHADSLGSLAGPAWDGLFLAVIGEGLRDSFHDEQEALPEAMLALIRSLDCRPEDRHPAA